MPDSPGWGWILWINDKVCQNVNKKVVGKSMINYQKLETVLLKAKSIVNGCQLMYLSEDVLGDARTQNHLMHGCNIRTKVKQ